MADDAAVRVRRAGAADVDALLHVSSALFQEDAGTHDPGVSNLEWPAQHGRDSFEALSDNPDRLALLAEGVSGDAVEVVGGLMGSYPDLSPYDTVRIAKLNSLWLHPAHRSTGLAARLVDEFYVWARERGAPYAEVSVYAANARAVRFYQRQGFAPHLQILRTQL